MTATRLARAAAIVAVFGLLSRLLGFAREVVLAAAYGTSAATDAFVNSLLIVNSVAAVLLYTLVTLIIPVFQRERGENGAASAWRLVSALAVWVGLLLVVLSSIIAIWPQAPAALFDLDPVRAADTASLIRIMAPAMALQGFSAIFTAMLQIHGRFAGPAAIGVVFNLGIILGVLVGQGSIGIEAAGWGVTIGAAFQVVLQLPQFWRLLREARAHPVLSHPRLAGVGLLALPVLGASVLQQVNNFTDKLFASSLEAGRVAALNFANALGQAPRVALLLPLLTPLFPLISRLMGEQRDTEALNVFRRVAGLLGLVAFPMMLLLAIYSHEVAQLAFQRRACGPDCVEQIAPPLLWYALGLWPGFFVLLLNRTLSAGNHQRAILWTTVVTVAVTIILDIVLLGPMQQAGLALAASIGVYVNSALLLLRLRQLYPTLSVADLARRQTRLLLAACVGAAVALLLNPVLPTTDVPSAQVAVLLVVKAAAAVAASVVAVRYLARDELAEGVRAVRSLVARPARQG